MTAQITTHPSECRCLACELRVTLPGRCAAHPAYEADYCPVCGTARKIGA